VHVVESNRRVSEIPAYTNIRARCVEFKM
jgi:hypothetical protein